MDSTSNPYSAPRTRVRGVNDEGVTPVMAEILGSASIWARFTSIINWITFVLMIIFILLLLAAFVMPFITGVAQDTSGNLFLALLMLVLYGLPAIMYWYYARSMGRYASAAKQVRESADQEDVAECFSASATFMKVTVFFAILALIVFAFGVISAIALPAYQDYIQAAQR